jgi:predicted RecA/RadA family phage recombinase
MPSIRIGYSSEFVLRNELVGIGSTATNSRLDVAGQIRSENTAGSGGVSTFREYQGFSQTQAEISNNILIDNGSSGPYSSLTGEIKITGETTVSSGSTVEVGKTKTLTVTDKFAVPLGDTNSRDNTPEAGTTRFNQDFGTLEFFDGANWKTVNKTSISGRGVMCGGSPAGEQLMDYIQIPTTGNAQYFGDLVNSGHFIHGCCGSETRGINGGGYDGGETNNSQSAIDYFTIASAGNSIDFGTLDAQHFRNCAACSSSTRGLFFAGGHPSYYNTIEYIEIGTLGNALDFGDQVTSAAVKSSFSSSTRGFSSGGFTSYSPAISVVTIASKGDATKFGELSNAGLSYAGCANGVKGIFAGGYTAGAQLMKSINYITMASEGNAQYFGDLSVGRNYPGGMATQTRAVFGCGLAAAPSTTTNLIDYVNIASSGDAVDFGDMTISTQRRRGTTDSHGGLGGF